MTIMRCSMRRFAYPTLLLLVLVSLAGCGEAPTGRRDAEQQSGDSKRGAGAERTSQGEAPKVIEFDPSTIKSPESKAFFDEGYAQGLRMRRPSATASLRNSNLRWTSRPCGNSGMLPSRSRRRRG